jgi:hypothetical protein
MTPDLLTSNLKNLCDAVLASGQIKTIQDAANLVAFYNEALKYFVTK